MEASLVHIYSENTLSERCPYGYIASRKIRRIALEAGEVRNIKAVNQYYYLINGTYSELISIFSDDERAYNPSDATLSDQQDEHFGYITLTNLASVSITVEFWVVSFIAKEKPLPIPIPIPIPIELLD